MNSDVKSDVIAEKKTEDLLNAGAENKRSLVRLLLFIFLIMLFILASGCYFNSYLQKQIDMERTTQLNEIAAQVQMNLTNALDAHWNYLVCAVNLLEGAPPSADRISERIGQLQQLLQMESLDSLLILLDSQGNYYDAWGRQGVWQDIGRLEQERCTFIAEGLSFQGSYWAFVQRLEEPLVLGDVSLTHAVLLKDVFSLSEIYDSCAFGGWSETYILKGDGTRMHGGSGEGRTIQAYDVLKGLEEMAGQEYPDIRAALAERRTISTNFRHKGAKYYYCLTSLAEYDTLLLFLIPAEYVAVGSVNMVGAVVRLLLIWSLLLLTMLMIMVEALMRQQSSARLVRQEQENLRWQEELNAQLEESNAMLASSKKAAEQAFRIAEGANRAKSSFLSNMSHDIRTPMNAIMGFATLLNRDVNDPEKVREHARKITASSQHLLGLINNVLDISKIEAGKTTLNLTDESIAELIENVDAIIRPQMKARQHNFEIFADGLTHQQVVMDKVRLNQILLNLLSNAMKYTPDGGHVTLTVHELPQHSKQLAHYRFIVADNGYGMAPEYLDRIFQAFTREEDSVTNTIQGTGLGMPITKSLLDLMGGNISVESEKGVGSTFTVDLELQISACREQGRQAAPKVPGGGPALAAAAEQGVLKGMHILVAEDNELNAEILRELLAMEGATCDIYENGQLVVEAFAASAPGQYQLVLVDVQMPVMNGYAATRAIRQLAHPLAAQTPIIAMTANAFAEDIRDALESGMDAHVAKPIDMAVLAQTVRKVLAARSEAMKEANDAV